MRDAKQVALEFRFDYIHLVFCFYALDARVSELAVRAVRLNLRAKVQRNVMLSSIAPLYCLWPRFEWSSMESAENCLAERRALSHRLRRRKLACNLNRIHVAWNERRFTIGLNLPALNTARPKQTHTPYKSVRKKSIFVKGTACAECNERSTQILLKFFVSHFLIRATKRLRRLSDDESHDEDEDDDIYENENKPFEFPKIQINLNPLFVSFIWYACRRTLVRLRRWIVRWVSMRTMQMARCQSFVFTISIHVNAM